MGLPLPREPGGEAGGLLVHRDRPPAGLRDAPDGWGAGLLPQRLFPSGRAGDPAQAGKRQRAHLPFPRLGVRPRRTLHPDQERGGRLRRDGTLGRTLRPPPDRRPGLVQGVRVREPEKRRAPAPGLPGGGGALDRPPGGSGATRAGGRARLLHLRGPRQLEAAGREQRGRLPRDHAPQRFRRHHGPARGPRRHGRHGPDRVRAHKGQGAQRHLRLRQRTHGAVGAAHHAACAADLRGAGVARRESRTGEGRLDPQPRPQPVSLPQRDADGQPVDADPAGEAGLDRIDRGLGLLHRPEGREPGGAGRAPQEVRGFLPHGRDGDVGRCRGARGHPGRLSRAAEPVERHDPRFARPRRRPRPGRPRSGLRPGVVLPRLGARGNVPRFLPRVAGAPGERGRDAA